MTVAGFQKIGVLGAGQMGAGIAQVAACSGLAVVMVDISSEQLAKATAGIQASLEKLESKGALPQGTKAQAIERMAVATSLDAFKDCDLVIEAVTENESVKTKLLTDVDRILKPEGILASNTSSIPITRLAAATRRPTHMIGMHFMNPVPLMKLVEVIPGMATEAWVTEKILSLCKALGKESVTSQDFPGFIVNRVLMPMINEAFDTLMSGVASAKDIDDGIRLGLNHPMGPLALADFIGLDTCLAILNVLHDGLGDPRYRPSPLLKKYVEAGFVGKKAKRGVYSY